jgi:diacylglycerol O-acyltransferase / wax synthase
MRRMDGVSAFMLAQEKPGSYMHTLKISVLDPTEMEVPWDFDRFRQSVARRLHLLPMFRWKFKRVPLGLHHPVWVDDPDFDLAYHIRRVACPAPGNRESLCELISQLYAWPLDMSKPLWICWVVEGMEDGSVVLVTLLHHAYTDGTGAARLMKRFYSAAAEVDPKEAPWKPEPTPGRMKLLARALVDLPVTMWRRLPRIGRGIVNSRRLKRHYDASGKALPPSALRDGRDSPINVMLGYGRTFVFETYDLEMIRTTAKKFGVTINDLFVASAAAAYRKFMEQRGYDVDSGPLVTAIPVSQRPPEDEDDCLGNMTSTDFLAMPVHILDPLERLRAASRAGNTMKEHLAQAVGLDLSSVLEVMPPVLLRLMDWWVARNGGKVGIWGNAALSNVPGPREKLYMGKIPVSNWISMGQIFHGLGLNTTVWSYAGQFNLSILADRNLLPDGWELVGYFTEAFEEYAQLADQQAEAA